MAEKEYEKAKYEHPIFGINWTGGIGRPTGIYWLDGDTVFAVHGSRAEERVLELGGILVATLRFDRDPFSEAYRGDGKIVRAAPVSLIEFG